MGWGEQILALAPSSNTQSASTGIATPARDQVAGSVRRRLSAESGCRLWLFTCMPVDLPRVRTIRNDFSWVRARYPAPQLKPTADLVGTSLVESGVVKAEAYLDGVETLIARYEADRYFAHRKEAVGNSIASNGWGSTSCGQRCRLRLLRRRGPIGRTIISFPSTVVHTLPTVLAESDVQVVVYEIANEWYQPKSRLLQADDFLGRVSTSARRATV